MLQITAIEPQKRKKGRFNIFVDGKFSFSVDERILTDEKLNVGQKITQLEIEKLVSEYSLAKNLEKVLRFLSYRLRSKKEILDYLKRKNLGEKEIDLIIKRLRKLELIDDGQFAKAFIESRLKFRPKGKRLLALELLRKGIDKEIIEKTLSELTFSDVELAKAAIAKKLPRFQRLEAQEARNKIGQFLARRGFSWEVIKVIIDTSLKTR